MVCLQSGPVRFVPVLSGEETRLLLAINEGVSAQLR